MKNILQSKILWVSLIALSLGFVGCNIFNPTESVNINDNDAEALSYEGYIKFRSNEYSEAEAYFKKAIAADSNYSSAWLGLMKSVLNRKLNANSETNVFSLLKYVNTSRESSVPFAGMDDNLAYTLNEVIDTVSAIVDEFIKREKNGKLDGKVTYKTISDGYIVLQMMKTMLILRKTTSQMDNCSIKKNSENQCDMKIVLNSLKDEPTETVEAFHAVFETCEQNPESMTSLFDSYLQGFGNLKEEAQRSAVGSMCGALAQQTEESKTDEAQQTKTLNIIIGQFGYSDISDDDGDGCFDEEIYDGEDNDGDGEIDEDIRDKSTSIKYDQERITKNMLDKKTEIKDMLVVREAYPNEKYETIDIDMNGLSGSADLNEWEFIYEKYDDRIGMNDHRLKFAAPLVFFNPNIIPDYETYLAIKREVAKDRDYNNLTYDLNFRKTYIGGCWVNYNEETFKMWFARENQ